MPLRYTQKVSKRLARNMNIRDNVQKVGEPIANGAFYGGLGATGVALARGTIGKTYAIGATAVAVGSLGKMVTQATRERQNKAIVSLIGKPRLLKAVALGTKNQVIRGTLLIASLAKTKAEQELVKKFAQGPLTTEEMRLFIKLTKRAKAQYAENGIQHIYDTIRVNQGIPEKTVKIIIERTAKAISKRNQVTTTEIDELVQTAVLPHFTSLFLTKYRINDPITRKKIYKLLEEQNERYFDKIKRNPNLTHAQLQEDAILKDTAFRIGDILVPLIGKPRTQLFQHEFVEQLGEVTNFLSEQTLAASSFRRVLTFTQQ